MTFRRGRHAAADAASSGEAPHGRSLAENSHRGPRAGREIARSARWEAPEVVSARPRDIEFGKLSMDPPMKIGDPLVELHGVCIPRHSVDPWRRLFFNSKRAARDDQAADGLRPDLPLQSDAEAPRKRRSAEPPPYTARTERPRQDVLARPVTLFITTDVVRGWVTEYLVTVVQPVTRSLFGFWRERRRSNLRSVGSRRAGAWIAIRGDKSIICVENLHEFRRGRLPKRDDDARPGYRFAMRTGVAIPQAWALSP